MGDEGVDPCECVWGHEMAMRRLLSLLRQSQAYCTDTECFEDVVGRQGQNQDSSFMLISLFFVFALVMYYIRPHFRSSFLESPRKGGDSNDFSGAPPTPPPATS